MMQKSQLRKPIMQTSKTALIVGATGLVGGHCLQKILETGQYECVTVLSRRPLQDDPGHPHLHVHLVDFDRLEESSTLVRADDVFCTLGTTIKKQNQKRIFGKSITAFRSRLPVWHWKTERGISCSSHLSGRIQIQSFFTIV